MFQESFRDGLAWTVGLTVKIKLRFRDGLGWTVGLTVKIKFRFRDRLEWTVGLTVGIKLRFRDGLVRTAGVTVEANNSSGVVPKRNIREILHTHTLQENSNSPPNPPLMATGPYNSGIYCLNLTTAI